MSLTYKFARNARRFSRLGNQDNIRNYSSIRIARVVLAIIFLQLAWTQVILLSFAISNQKSARCWIKI